MKVFIVFLALLVVCSMGLIYQGDMNYYMHEQLTVKEMAEECACGAALLIDQKAYGTGKLVFLQDEGNDYAKNFVQFRQENRNNDYNKRELSLNLQFEDDEVGYGKENTEKRPAVIATVISEGKDIFRLPFLEVKTVKRIARYELDKS